MNDKNIEKIGNFDKPHFDPVVICPSNYNNFPMFFDPSLNGHDFFSKTITCSCLNNTNTNHKCNNLDEDGCRRTRKNEYARQQMKKYREKLKQDPIRYKKYLQSERVRNARRKLKKIQTLILEEQNDLSIQQLHKLKVRHQNLLNKARNRFGQEYLVDIKNTQRESNGSYPSGDNFDDSLEEINQKTYSNKKKRNNKNFKHNNIKDENFEKITNSEEPEMPSLHFFSSIFNGKKIDKKNATVYEIGSGGPFSNLKIVNNARNSKDYIVPEKNLINENIVDIKEEPLSDTENENSSSQVYDNYNNSENESISDAESFYDNDFKINRICAMVNCPSRYEYQPDIKYYPFPPQKDIRDCWFKLIKQKTNQWIIDPDGFVCSLHFAPAWFQKSPSYGNKMLLLNAVPTIYPNSSDTQYNINLPIVDNRDYYDPEKFKNYYELSSMKLREQEKLIQNQQFTIDNYSEYKIIHDKRIEKLYKVIDEFKNTLHISTNSNNNSDDFNSFLQKIDDIKTDLTSSII